MKNKLARAQHRHVSDQTAHEKASARNDADQSAMLSASKVLSDGHHAGIDRTLISGDAFYAQENSAAGNKVLHDGHHTEINRRAVRSVPAHMRKTPSFQSDTKKRVSLSTEDPNTTRALFVGGSHAGPDRTKPDAPASPHPNPAPSKRLLSEAHEAAFRPLQTPTTSDPGATGAIDVGGYHAGVDKTCTIVKTTPVQDTAASVGTSAALISVATLISRALGFARTWVMAFALGSTMLASSYAVANAVPNLLFELAAGGMIVTAFLPVYVSVKKRIGAQASNEYASNLLTLVVVLLGVISAFCIAFPSLIIYTQSFYSDQNDMGTAVFFFQFFAIQIVFYGASSIMQGLLNANRAYLWSSLAPGANSIIVIITFLLYTFVAPHNMQLALYIIAIGNPLGVFAQLAIQLPPLKSKGIRLRPYINFHDPELRETLKIGGPTMLVMLISSIILSVQQAAAYSFADNGPSILSYARLWFTLPYAFLAVPITTPMFTELSVMQAEGNAKGVKRGIVGGTNQILFFMIPFTLYLIVFSLPLVMMYHFGAFTMENVGSIASYLSVLALSLPVYGVNTYLQKTFSSLRKMGVFALVSLVAASAQITLTLVGASHRQLFPIETIAAGEVLFYVVADVCLFAYLRRRLGSFGLRSVLKASLSGLLLGGVGAAAGGAVLLGLTSVISPLTGSIPQAFAYVVAGGVIALMVTFGLAMKLNLPESAIITTTVTKIKGTLRRA